MFRLIFLNGKMKGRRIAVQQGSVTIGRDPASHIDLAYDDEVSRNHAVIEHRSDGVYIRDLGAMNRTEVNGKQVAEARLKHGDKLEIGRTQFEFQDIEETTVGPRRSLNKLQVVTFAAIGLLVLAQLVFVFVLPMLDDARGTQAGGDAVGSSTGAVVAAASPAGLDTNAAAAPDSPAFEQVIAELQARDGGPVSSTQAAVDEVSGEVQQLRQALTDLQQQLADLNKQTAQLTNPAAAGDIVPGRVIETTANIARVEQPAPTNAEPAAATTPAAPVATAAPADALLQKARELLAEATKLIGQNRLTEGDAVLERIQVLAPEFTPAYVERARVYEAQGLLGKSGQQWTKVMELSVGTPLYEQAAAERQRLARAELLQTMTTDKEEAPGPAGDQKLARRIRIVGVEREKFDANQEFDEMRLLRINVKPRMSEGEIDPADFVCTVVFYDRGLFKNVVRPTRAVAPKDALKVDGAWPAGEQRTLTAAYIVPKDFRDEEEKAVGERRTYEGYRVLIYYKGVLQDETALPKTLASLPAPAPPSRR
jgi:hypothetical protein